MPKVTPRNFFTLSMAEDELSKLTIILYSEIVVKSQNWATQWPAKCKLPQRWVSTSVIVVNQTHLLTLSCDTLWWEIDCTVGVAPNDNGLGSDLITSGAVVQVNLCQKLFFLQNMGRTCCVQKLFWMSKTISVHNMFSPCSKLGIFMYILNL